MSATSASFDLMELRELAPQAGFEPATLRLTAGKRNVSRALPPCAGGCRIARHHSKNPAIFGLRFVPALAAICRSLVHRKGKKRATLIATNAPSALWNQANCSASAVDRDFPRRCGMAYRLQSGASSVRRLPQWIRDTRRTPWRGGGCCRKPRPSRPSDRNRA